MKHKIEILSVDLQLSLICHVMLSGNYSICGNLVPIISGVPPDFLEHVPLGLESSDPPSGTCSGDRGSNRGETGSGECGASGVLQSGLGLLECISDQLHSGSEGLLHSGEGGDLVIGEGEGRGGNNVSTDSHNHVAGRGISSDGHNCSDQGDDGNPGPAFTVEYLFPGETITVVKDANSSDSLTRVAISSHGMNIAAET